MTQPDLFSGQSQEEKPAVEGVTIAPQEKYIFHQDPGHGWVEVPMAELRLLGIAGKITPYSYRIGNRAFLEEDCDAGTWEKAWKEKFGHLPQLVEVHLDVTPIRDYPDYRP